MPSCALASSSVGDQQLELAVGHVERDAVAGLDQRRAGRRRRTPARRAARWCRTPCRSCARRRCGSCPSRRRARASSGSGRSRPRACPARPWGRRCAAPGCRRPSRRGWDRRRARRGPPASRTPRRGRCGCSSAGVAADVLDHRAARREVAAQHRHAAGRLDRIRRACGSRSGRAPSRPRRSRRFRVLPATVRRVSSRCVADLLHQARVAAGPVEVLHVVIARRLEVDQHRHLAADRGRTPRARSRCRAGARRR